MPTKRVLLDQTSFTGMRDSVDPTTADPRKATVLQNVYPIDPELGGGLEGRPGFTGLGAGPDQLGGPGTRRGQRSFQFNELDGTKHTIVFVGGQMYEYNWGSDTFTDLSANQPTTSTTAKIYCVTFADRLIVSDGVNAAWSWDGSGAGAGAFSVLTNAPVFYGPIVVYYAKLFGIDASDRATIMWSEENQPNTGYDSGTFDNAWTLGQTDQDPLTALVATNEALYYFRAHSIGSISGRVTPEFRADGTREGVSETLGTSSPDAILVDSAHIHFFDSSSRLHKIVPGQGTVPLWKDLRELTENLPETGLPNAVASIYPQADVLLFGVRASGASENNTILVFNRSPVAPREDEYVGPWRGSWTFTALDLVEDTDGERFLFHLSDDGYVYRHGNPTGQLWDDELVAGTEAIQHVVRGTPMAHNKKLTLHFDRAHVIHRTPSNMTNVAFQMITPEGGLANAPSYNVDGGTTLWDAFLWDTGIWSVAAGETRVAIGVSARARWAQLEIQHAELGEQFGFLGWELEAYPITEEVEAA